MGNTKVSFCRRISDFFTQGHWEVIVTKHDWEVTLGGFIHVGGAPGFHFDRVGFVVHFWTRALGVYWVDNN